MPPCTKVKWPETVRCFDLSGQSLGSDGPEPIGGTNHIEVDAQRGVAEPSATLPDLVEGDPCQLQVGGKPSPR